MQVFRGDNLPFFFGLNQLQLNLIKLVMTLPIVADGYKIMYLEYRYQDH